MNNSEIYETTVVSKYTTVYINMKTKLFLLIFSLLFTIGGPAGTGSRDSIQRGPRNGHLGFLCETLLLLLVNSLLLLSVFWIQIH